MKHLKLYERSEISSVDVAEVLIYYLDVLKIKTLKNINSEDMFDVRFVVEAYDFSLYDSYSKFFDILKRLNIKWYFESGNHHVRSYMYLTCQFNDINEDEFKILDSTTKYNI